MQTALQKCISDLKNVYEERQAIFMMKNTLKNRARESQQNENGDSPGAGSSFTELEPQLDQCLDRTNKTLMETINRLQTHM